MCPGQKSGEPMERKRMDAWKTAKEMLRDVTPLKRDCGRLCGARCCRSLEGEETGMLLFPGEEDDYEEAPGWRILPAGQEMLVICPGACDRGNRPLACRMFPLLPLLQEGEIRVRTDERARAVCPLARTGKQGMDPAFVEAVGKAGEILLQDGEQKAFLERLTEAQTELRELRKRLGAPRGRRG